ncbi:MAG: hypothetical protein U0871_17205 [Gemmataceae bacterium]
MPQLIRVAALLWAAAGGLILLAVGVTTALTLADPKPLAGAVSQHTGTGTDSFTGYHFEYKLTADAPLADGDYARPLGAALGLVLLALAARVLTGGARNVLLPGIASAGAGLLVAAAGGLMALGGGVVVGLVTLLVGLAGLLAPGVLSVAGASAYDRWQRTTRLVTPSGPLFAAGALWLLLGGWIALWSAASLVNRLTVVQGRVQLRAEVEVTTAVEPLGGLLKGLAGAVQDGSVGAGAFLWPVAAGLAWGLGFAWLGGVTLTGGLREPRTAGAVTLGLVGLLAAGSLGVMAVSFPHFAGLPYALFPGGLAMAVPGALALVGHPPPLKATADDAVTPARVVRHRG